MWTAPAAPAGDRREGEGEPPPPTQNLRFNKVTPPRSPCPAGGPGPGTGPGAGPAVDPVFAGRYSPAAGNRDQRPRTIGRGRERITPNARMGFYPITADAGQAEAGPTIAWEEANGLLCDARNFATLVEAADSAAGGTGFWFAVVQCQECGLCFTNPRPAPTAIGRFYPTCYRPHRTPKRRGIDRVRRDNLRPGWLRADKERHALP